MLRPPVLPSCTLVKNPKGWGGQSLSLCIASLASVHVCIGPVSPRLTCASPLPLSCSHASKQICIMAQPHMKQQSTFFQTTFSFFTAAKNWLIDSFRVELCLIRGYRSYYTPVSSCSTKGSSIYPREGRQICFLRAGRGRLLQQQNGGGKLFMGLLVYPLWLWN